MSRMPAQTNRVHLDPYWLGDSVRAIRKAALRRPGQRFIDINLQRCANGVICMHWGTAAQGGWYFIQHRNGKGRRRMTNEELHRPISKWNVTDVQRWRQTATVNKTFQSKVRPLTYEQAIALCKRYFVIPCFELKSPSFGDEVAAVSLVTYAQRYGRTVYYMTLVTMGGWRKKGLAFKKAGAQIALLAHGAPKPPDLANYVPGVFERVWGSWA